MFNSVIWACNSSSSIQLFQTWEYQFVDSKGYPKCTNIAGGWDYYELTNIGPSFGGPAARLPKRGVYLPQHGRCTATRQNASDGLHVLVVRQQRCVEIKTCRAIKRSISQPETHAQEQQAVCKYTAAKLNLPQVLR